MKAKGSNTNIQSTPIDANSGAIAQPVRPQKPKDGMGFGGGTFKPGFAPEGGYQAVWNFSDRPNDYKNSPSTKPGLKVY